MELDDFLCIAQEDSAIASKLRNNLESRAYKVCNHLRDFSPGELIAENICRAVKTSKPTLCLLSDNFFRSWYWMEEFHNALNVSLQLRKRRLILIPLQQPEDLEGMVSAASLQQYVTTHTYLDYHSTHFHDRLLYILLQKKLCSNSRTQCDHSEDTAASVDDQPLILYKILGVGYRWRWLDTLLKSKNTIRLNLVMIM